MDLSKTVEPRSDQINADDLISGPRTITITRVTASDTPDQPVSVYFEGDNGKPWKPCKSMRRVLIAAWGADASQYAGRSATIYNDPDVQFGGMKVGGIRVSHMSHLREPLKLALTATKAKRVLYKVEPLATAPSAVDTAAAQSAARDAASRGKDAFSAWWNSPEGKASRVAVKPIIDELRGIAAAADEPSPADEPTLTPEQQAEIAAAEADWRASQAHAGKEEA